MTSHIYERGDIAYVLTVIERNGRFFVEWKCPVCGVHRASDQGCEFASEALGRAQARLFSDHHVPVHVLSNGPFSARG